MKVKKEVSLLAIIFAASFMVLATNTISGKLSKPRRSPIKHIIKRFEKRIFCVNSSLGKYWISLPEEISTKYKTPIVVLLHGGVFKERDYGKVFLKGIFEKLIKERNVILALPVMPESSHPVWRAKDNILINHVIESLIQKYRLNPESPIFLGGFSNGAEVALKLVFSNRVKVKGVFAFSGGIRLIKNRSLIKKADKNIAIFLSCGQNDANWLGSTVSSFKYLKKNSFKNLTIKGYPGLEHWISKKQALFFLDWVKKNS